MTVDTVALGMPAFARREGGAGDIDGVEVVTMMSGTTKSKDIDVRAYQPSPCMFNENGVALLHILS